MKKKIFAGLLLCLVFSPVFSFSMGEFFSNLFKKKSNIVEDKDLVLKTEIELLDVKMNSSVFKSSFKGSEMEKIVKKLEIDCLRISIKEEKEVVENFVLEFEDSTIKEIYENLYCKNYLELDKNFIEKISKEGFYSSTLKDSIGKVKTNMGLLFKLRKLI